MNQAFTFTGRIRSFHHAFRGIGLVIASQHNAWVHLTATLTVVGAGIALRLDRQEWCWMIVACVAVWTAEVLNTAFEFLCDVASPEYHPAVKNAKDAAAGAVLLAAIGSGVIGLIVLGPHLLKLARV